MQVCSAAMQWLQKVILVVLGPPPLDQDKIAEIPKCEIVQEQVDSKLQCSVCWEDFQLQEIVRQLPCSVRGTLRPLEWEGIGAIF